MRLETWATRIIGEKQFLIRKAKLMALTEAQVAFFEAFGYLHLPGYMRDELDWICEEHEKLFVAAYTVSVNLTIVSQV